MPLHSGSSPGIVSQNIREMQAAGHPHRVAVAAALSNADRHPRASGGIIGYQGGGEIDDVLANGVPEDTIEIPHRQNSIILKGPTGVRQMTGDPVINARGGTGFPVKIPNAPLPDPRYLGAAMQQQLKTGGIVGYQGGGELGMGPGIAPSVGTMNPMEQQQIQRYEAMPLAQLRAVVSTLGASPQGQIAQRVLQQKQMTPSPIASVMAMPQMKRGGEVIAESHPPGKTGYLSGSTPGRADQVHTAPPAGSYVWPADVISGLGEGNSNAGAKLLERALARGPKQKRAFGGGVGSGENQFARHAMRRAFGAGMRPEAPLHIGPTASFAQGLSTGLGGAPGPRGARGSGPPRAPTFQTFRPRFAKGGREDNEDPVEIMAAHGELITPPHIARLWGGGDLKKGHDLFDQAVLELRKKHIQDLKSLKGPVKS